MLETIQRLMASPIAQFAGAIVGLLLGALVAYTAARRGLVTAIKAVAKRTATSWDDEVVEAGVFSKLAWLAPALVAYYFGYLLPDQAEELIQRFIYAYVLAVMLLTVNSLLNAIIEIYNKYDFATNRPIKGYIQVVKLLMWIAAGVVVVAVLLDKSPWAFLSGLGAMTAVLLLVFRDTILSLVASIQLATNDMVRIGDWLEIPKYGADGDVIDIALHTVKIQNWDKTITTVPTHRLIEDSFKNWRGMSDSGGRRIKRSIVLDQTSVGFLSPEQIAQLGKIDLLSEYLRERAHEISQYNSEHAVDRDAPANGRGMTNIGTFRAYILAYLGAHPKIDKNMTLLVRQLAPSPAGIPIELYCFTNDTRWAVYEAIQGDIFDHLLAVVGEFGLRVFQQPSGADFKSALAP